MPFSRPTLATLIDRIASDIESRLPGATARLPRSLLSILGRVESGAAHGLYGYLDWVSRQVMPDTADSDVLDRWSTIWGIPRKAAVTASGPLDLTGTAGVLVPAGTIWQRGDGAQFATTADVTFAGLTAVATVTAATPGAAGNTVAATQLTLATPIAGVSSTATVDIAGLVGGTDIETDDELRARLLARIRNPPQGGSSADYANWALAVAGVTRAWVSPMELGAGTVTVRFMRDDDVNPIPTAAEVLVVQTAIDALRPVTADVFVLAPVAAPLNFTIQLKPNDAPTQAAVTAELVDLLRREAIPGGTLLLSHINEAIAIATGETDHVLLAPVANVVSGTGQITTLGVITWQAL